MSGGSETNTRGDILFREVQRPRQWYYWGFVIFLTGATWAIAVFQLLGGSPQGNNPATNGEMAIILFLCGAIFPGVLGTVSLTTEVRKEGLFIRFTPIHLRYRRIDTAGAIIKIREYSAFDEYGGYGIKYGDSGVSYTIGGDRGVEIRSRKGETVLIGSRRPEELSSALNLTFAPTRGN